MRYFPYELVPQRKGIIIEVEDGKGNKGWGDIAPYPSLSKETLEEAEAQVRAGGGKNLFPSVAFGLDAARLALQASPFCAPISYLLMGSVKEIHHKAEKIIAEGATSAKIKIAHLPVIEARALLSALKQALKLRIDLNRSWSLSQALDFFSPFGVEDFDYIEEPLKDPRALHDFPFPVAADESLRDTPLDEILEIPRLKAVVFKPTLLGGIQEAKRIKEQAEKRGIEFVLSSCYESGVGILGIVRLAQHLGVTTPLGIDTYSTIQKDIIPPLHIERGYIHILSSPSPCASPSPTYLF